MQIEKGDAVRLADGLENDVTYGERSGIIMHEWMRFAGEDKVRKIVASGNILLEGSSYYYHPCMLEKLN